MRVLACAYACNPYRGSEEGVGWGWVNAIARNHEVWVLTARYHRRDIEEALRREPENCNRLHFAYVEQRPWHYRPGPGWIRFENSIAKPFMNWAYRSWLRSAFVLGKKLHREIGFDLVHQITYVGFRFPGHLWKLDIPFVWGPIGGLENTSLQLLPAMGAKGAVYFACRNMVNTLQKRFLPAPKHAMRAARGGIIAATGSIQREIRKWYGEESTVICEIGLPREIAAGHSRRAVNDPIRICWSGLHVPGKALPLLLAALAGLPERVKWRLDILGTGPNAQSWRRLSERLGIEVNCSWLGKQPRVDALRVVHESHVFVTTSLKELTSTVVIEALAQGVPVVCPDHCGFSDAIDESCGLRLPISTARDFVAALAHAIERLHEDEPERRRLAEGALERSARFSWEVKARQLEAIYAAKAGAARAEATASELAGADASEA